MWHLPYPSCALKAVALFLSPANRLYSLFPAALTPFPVPLSPLPPLDLRLPPPSFWYLIKHRPLSLPPFLLPEPSWLSHVISLILFLLSSFTSFWSFHYISDRSQWLPSALGFHFVSTSLSEGPPSPRLPKLVTGSDGTSRSCCPSPVPWESIHSTHGPGSHISYWGCQPLPQWHCSRACLQLPATLFCSAMGSPVGPPSTVLAHPPSSSTCQAMSWQTHRDSLGRRWPSQCSTLKQMTVKDRTILTASTSSTRIYKFTLTHRAVHLTGEGQTEHEGWKHRWKYG